MDTVHLSNFCKPCHIVVHTYMKALNEGKVYKYSTVMFSGWGPHLEDRCSTCEHVKSIQLGGSQRGKLDLEDHQSKISTLLSATWSALHLIHLFHTLLLCPQHWINSYQSECKMSIMLLNSLVELINCGAVVCFQCCCLWLKTSGTISCPCCYEQPLSGSMVWPASNFVQDALRKISVICMNCA